MMDKDAGRLGGLLLTPRVQGALLTALAAFWIFARLGHGHLANYDDCYYAEKAKEMLRSGDWLTPRFAGVPRWDNSPLYLWLTAAAFRVLGVTDYAAILFSALSGVLCVALLFRIGARIGLDPFERWAASFILLTTQYFLKYSRHAMFDVFLSFLFLLSIDAYLRAIAGRRKQFLLLGVWCGLGVLTKSVLGFFPIAVSALHLAATGRARVLRSSWFLGGIAAAALVAAPWYLYSYLAHGAPFLEEHAGWLLWKRAFVLGRDQVSWTHHLGYMKDLAVHYWPWLPLAIGGAIVEARTLIRRRSDAEADPTAPAAGAALSPAERAVLLFAWVLVVVGTMSLAIEKKLWYIMTAFPALAVFASRGAGTFLRGETARRRTVYGGFAVLAVGAAVMNLTPLGARYERNPDLQQMALVTRGTVPVGQVVLNLDTPYWPIANQFLFYSDRNLTLPLKDPRLVREGLDRGGFALLRADRYVEVTGENPRAYPVIASSGRFVLVKAAPAVPAVLPPRDVAR